MTMSMTKTDDKNLLLAPPLTLPLVSRAAALLAHNPAKVKNVHNLLQQKRILKESSISFHVKHVKYSEECSTSDVFQL